jgi:hypothetical protein
MLKKKNAMFCGSHYRPTSEFNFRARCPARLLNWCSIRNNQTLPRAASRSFPVLMASTKGARPFRGEAQNGCVRQACLFIIKIGTIQQRPKITFLTGFYYN